MSLLTIWNNRDSTVLITVKDSDGVTIVLAAEDFIRVKIGQEQGEPILDMKAGVATANGSSFANTNPFTLTLKRADIALLGRGIWMLEVSLYDDSADHFYFAQEFQLEVRGTQAGDIE